MIRATRVLRGDALGRARDEGAIVDRVVLDADERHRRRVALTGEAGTTLLLDLPQATQLRDGDGLALDDGRVVAVVAKPEALVEVEAEGPDALARLAWHIGNRHTDLQVVDGRLRLRRDHVLEEMLRGLGARLTPVTAPFDPEAGAYGHHHHDDDHAHPYPHAHGA